MDRKPPLPVSPRRLRPRPRRVLRSPPGTTKQSQQDSPFRRSFTQTMIPTPAAKPPLLHQMISSELMDIAKTADGEPAPASPACRSPSPLFERGRFYDLYSARRDERLKRKQEEIAAETAANDPTVAVELAKRRNAKKAVVGSRKSVPKSFSVTHASGLRSPMSSSKEMKRPSAPLASGKVVTDAGRRIGTRLVRRI